MWKATITPAIDFHHGNAVASLLFAKDYDLIDTMKSQPGVILNPSRKIRTINPPNDFG
jgi:hypothetical protein